MKEQPECITNSGGNRVWSLHGKFHREDGPAVEFANGTKAWWLNGNRHREDGPALEYADGYKEWYLHGKEAHPETIVDYHLMRGTFCYYNEQTQTLHFDENE